MSSIIGAVENSCPLLPVVFARPASLSPKTNGGKTAEAERVSTFALVDTGATCCFITAALASRLEVFPVAEVDVGGIHGSQLAPVYAVSLFIPDIDLEREKTYAVRAMFSSDNKFQAILGMDVLSPGQLTFHASGKFEFSI